MSEPVAIIGGGLTGLVAAERLHAAAVGVSVFEAENEPGGACRSMRDGDFVFDHTGHLLHVGRPETEAYLESLGVWSELAVHERRSAVVIGGHSTPYPVQIHSHGLAPEVRRDCLLGFIHAWAGGDSAGEPASFEEWVLRRFGRGLAEHFFFPYNQKLYRARPDELSLDWVGRYVPKPTLEEVVDGALGLHRDAVGYNAVFRYPRQGGIRLLPDSVAAAVPDLRLGSRVTTIDLEARWLELADGTRVPFEILIFTGSLPALVDMLRDPLPAAVRAAREALRWVRVAGLCLGVAGEAPRAEHWLYFPDPELPFYRVGFPSNHGRVAPPGCHTLTAEISLDPGLANPQELCTVAEEKLVDAGLLTPDRVLARQLTVIDPGYVVFDHRRRNAVAELRHFLGERKVLLAGRWAEWKYSAMEDAILDGMAAARRCRRRLDAG